MQCAFQAFPSGIEKVHVLHGQLKVFFLLRIPQELRQGHIVDEEIRVTIFILLRIGSFPVVQGINNGSQPRPAGPAEADEGEPNTEGYGGHIGSVPSSTFAPIFQYQSWKFIMDIMDFSNTNGQFEHFLFLVET